METVCLPLKRSLKDEEQQVDSLSVCKKPKRKYTTKYKVCDLPEFPLEIWIFIVEQSGSLYDQMKCLLKLMMLNKSILFSLRGADPFWAEWWKITFDKLFPCVNPFYRYFHNISKLYPILKNDWKKETVSQLNLTTVWEKAIDIPVAESDLIHSLSSYELTAITFQLEQILNVPRIQNHSHHTDLIFKKKDNGAASQNLQVHYYKSVKFQSFGLRNLSIFTELQEPIQEVWDPEQFGRYFPNPYLIKEISPFEETTTIYDEAYLESLSHNSWNKNQYQILYSANSPNKILAILPDSCQWPQNKAFNTKDWATIRAKNRSSLCSKNLCNGILPTIRVGILDDSCSCIERDKSKRQFGGLEDLREGFLKRKPSVIDPKPFAHILSFRKQNSKSEFSSAIVYNPPVGRETKTTKEDLQTIILPSTCKSLESRFSKKGLIDFFPRMFESLLMMKIEPTFGPEQFRHWVETAFDSSSFFLLYPNPTYAAQLDVSLKPFISRFHNLLNQLCKKLSPSKMQANGKSISKIDIPHVGLITNKGEFAEVLRRKFSKDARASLRFDSMEYHHCFASCIQDDILYGVNSQIFPSEIDNKSSHYYELVQRWRQWQQFEFSELPKPFPPVNWINLPCKSVFLENGERRTIDDALNDMSHLYAVVSKDVLSKEPEFTSSRLELIIHGKDDIEIVEID